jgi:HAE1 family hydrophobic/amphiphilic exporter-1
MRHLTRLAVERPVTILMIILGLVIMGVQGYSAMKVARYPTIVIPYVNVVVSWPGAAPEDIEQYITKPIENAVAGISGVDTVSSTDRQGTGVTSVRFLPSVDPNQAAINVSQAVSRIQGQLPSDASAPSIVKADPSARPIMNIAISGPPSVSLGDLYSSAINDVQPRLLAVLGVAAANVSGGQVDDVEVQVDPAKMNAYGLSLSAISSALESQNIDVPAGTVTTNSRAVSIRTLGRFNNIDDIKNLIITTAPTVVRVSDVANVLQTHQDITQILRLNGQPAVGISIVPQPDANIIDVANGVRAALAQFDRQHLLPDGAKFTVVTDDSQFTRNSVESVQTDLMLAVLITGLVLLLFLHMLRSTIIVLLAVPTSLISTFLVMYAFGFSLDTVSLLALALTIGILVDDSIVVLENITRHLHMGEQGKEAAINGRAEIGMAAMAITFTDVVVYVPVAFMSGIIGQLFREYGLSIATATLFSLFISFTLTPMLASRWMTKAEMPTHGLWGWISTLWERGYARLVDFYGRTLGWALRRRPVVLFVAAMALAVAIAFLPLHVLGVEYAPSEDDNTFSANVLLPIGTALSVTDAATQQLEKILRSEPGVTDIMATVGSSSGALFGNAAGTAGASVTVQLVPKTQRSRSVFQVINDVRQKARSIKGASFQFQTAGFIGVGFGAPLNITLSGPDENTLINLADQVA